MTPKWSMRSPPGAKVALLLLPARAITPPDVALLLRVSAARGNIVALTFSTCERCFSAGQLRLVDRRYDRHVSVHVATGDQGPLGRTFCGAPAHARGVALPTASPLVTAVGGTRLAVDHDGGYASDRWGP